MLMLSASIQNDGQNQKEQLDTLLQAVAKGDKRALAQVYDCTHAAVYGLSLSYLKNPEDAADVAQDVYVQIWNCAAGFRAKGSPMAWLLTVTRNMALEKLRKNSKTQELLPEQWESIPAAGNTAQVEDWMVLQAVLTKLTEEEQRIVMLHAVAGMKHKEIAQLLKIPLATALSKYNRALKKLKKDLEGEDLP